jgi:hypothetical protein
MAKDVPRVVIDAPRWRDVCKQQGPCLAKTVSAFPRITLSGAGIGFAFRGIRDTAAAVPACRQSRPGRPLPKSESRPQPSPATSRPPLAPSRSGPGIAPSPNRGPLRSSLVEIPDAPGRIFSQNYRRGTGRARCSDYQFIFILDVGPRHRSGDSSRHRHPSPANETPTRGQLWRPNAPLLPQDKRKKMMPIAPPSV